MNGAIFYRTQETRPRSRDEKVLPIVSMICAGIEGCVSSGNRSHSGYVKQKEV